MSDQQHVVRFEVLGPIRVVADGGECVITAGRDRAVLALLVLQSGRLVSVEQLIRAIWDDRPPVGARTLVQGCVSRLRKQLAGIGVSGAVIVTDPAGYRLQVPPEQVDLGQFRVAVTSARAAAAQGRHDEASGLFRGALGLWRGPAFAGIEGRFVGEAAAAIEEERVQAAEDCVQSQLEIGQGRELIGELTELVGRFPYRERLHAALMLALYRSGRQADALAAYRSAAQRFRDELGTDPGEHLQRVHQAILRREPALAGGATGLPAAATTAGPAEPEPPPGAVAQVELTTRAGGPAVGATRLVPRELPADLADFTGRAEALRQLDAFLTGSVPGTRATTMVISAIAGAAGVGKTALAVRWAHRVADRFPDGQLYLNLRGHGAGQPLRAVDALAALLRSLGSAPDQIPADAEQAARLYRSYLAGRRMLIVLDNAGSAEQVRPLLPGGSGSLVLVTSRDRLTGLVARDGARRLSLDVLAPAEACQLLVRTLGEQRAGQEPEALAELARVCGFLPLALRIAAATLSDHPGRTISSYVADLTTGDRLSALQVADDPDSAVRVAFDQSYREMPAGPRRLFRLLGLTSGDDVTAPAAAAMAELSLPAAREQLEHLAAAHLLEVRAAGRYAFHDLLRLYARQLAQDQEPAGVREAAVRRLLLWSLQTVHAASQVLYPAAFQLPAPPATPVPPLWEFAGPAAAISWLDAERANLLGSVALAAQAGPRHLSWLLADRLRGYFWRRGATAQWREAAAVALTAAELEGDLCAQAMIHYGFGDSYLAVTEYAIAGEHLAKAHALAREAEWTPGLAVIVGNLGFVHWALGAPQRAIECNEQAYAMQREVGMLAAQAASLGNLGILRRELGQLRHSRRHLREAIELFRARGSEEGTAGQIVNLAETCHELGDLAQAQQCADSGVDLCRKWGLRFIEADGLRLQAMVARDLGRLSAAAVSAIAAIELAMELGDRRIEGQSRDTLGTIRLREGDLRQARECHQHALRLARETGDRLPEALALCNLAAVHHRAGDAATAGDLARLSLELARQVGYRVVEGSALVMLARISLRVGDPQAAERYATEALALHGEIGCRLGEADAVMTLAEFHAAAGAPARAAELTDRAAEIYAAAGAPAPPADQGQEP